MSILLVALSVLDFARMTVYKVQAQRAMEITANSLITNYDKAFQENYGLFMAKKGDLTKKADFLLSENFQMGKVKNPQKAVRAVGMEPAEIKEQILEYMKYRGPLIAVSKLYSMFSSMESVLSTGDKFSDRMDTELSNADFLEALNEYRYYLHGWTFHDDRPDYKYIRDDSKEAFQSEGKDVIIEQSEDLFFRTYPIRIPKAGRTNNYFVRSFMDFPAENPYSPHMNMGDTSLFRNAWEEFDIERYALFFDNWPVLEMDAYALGHRSRVTPTLAFEHDQVIEQIMDEYAERHEKGEEGAAAAWEALNDLSVFIPHNRTAEDYEREKIGEEVTDAYSWLYRYLSYCDDRPAKDKELDYVVIDTEWMQRIAFLNLLLNYDAQHYRKAYQTTARNYGILMGLKEANKRAKEKLSEVAKHLESYKQQVKKEMASLTEGDSKDPNYMASIQPKLEDKLEMIALMEEQLNKVQSENKFDENIQLLDQMIQKLCVPPFYEFEDTWTEHDILNFRYMELESLDTLEYEEFHELLSATKEHIKRQPDGKLPYGKKFKELYDYGAALEKALGIERSLTFDKEGFLKLKEQYDENCRSMQIDFNKEQLFVHKAESGEDPKATAQKSSGSLRDIMKVADKIFSAIFSFGSGKELSKEEYKALPSKVYFESEETKLDKGAMDVDTGSAKSSKKTGKRSKSWFSGIKNIITSFKKLAQDPLGTLYVNEYIMTGFRSSATGVGDYKEQINLKFQDKNKNPKKEELRLESEIEYVIGGNRTDLSNNSDVASKIILLRVLPNMLYIFTNSDTNSLAISLATAITAIFPPLYPLVYLIVVVMWAIAESLVDVFVLRQGQKVAFLKTTGDFMLSPSGFMEIARVFANVAIEAGADAVKGQISKGLDELDNFVTEKAKAGKEFIKKKVGDLATSLGADAIQKNQITEYVSDKYQMVEEAISDYEKTIDNYVEAVVGKYMVKVEKDRAQGKKTDAVSIDELSEEFASQMFDSIKEVAKENAAEVIPLINKKLQEELHPDIVGSLEMLEKIKNDYQIQAGIEKGKNLLRKKLEQKLDELVFDELEKEFTEGKQKVKDELQGYLNSKIDLGTEKLQNHVNESLKNVFSNTPEIKVTEKSSSGFKLGYEDYLRIYLLFVEEDVKLLRILDLVQLRENKDINGYMTGVEVEMKFDVAYLFLPRLIEIAKKQSSAIKAQQSDYERVDFKLRSVAGY